MNLYSFSESDRVNSLSQRLGNYVNRKIARHIPKHLEKLTDQANKDTHKANYMHEVFGGIHRAVDVHNKKKALRKMYKMLDNKDISKVNRRFQSLTNGMSIPQIKAAKLGLKEAYLKAGKDDD